MLIGHISDTHLGASPYGLIEREKDFYEAFEEAVDIMIKEHVDAVIHSGDIFDAPKPSGTALVRFFRGIRRLAESGAKVFFTLGEHDISRMPATPSPFLFSEMNLATYVGDGEPHTYNGLTVVGFHKHRKSEIDSLRDKLKGLERLQVEGKKVLVLHQALIEFHEFAGEITQQDLPKGFDYYAMGHLHDRKQASFEGFRGPICYPGSTEATSVEGIREREKGFYLVDLSGETASAQWIKLNSVRPQLKLEVEYEEIDRIIGSVLEKIGPYKKSPMVNITVKGKNVDRDIAYAKLKQLCDMALYCQKSVIDEAIYADEISGRPADIDREMMELAAKIMKSSNAASFAINELLPALSEGRLDEVANLMWSAFKAGRNLND